jgi:hypothetical protein
MLESGLRGYLYCVGLTLYRPEPAGNGDIAAVQRLDDGQRGVCAPVQYPGGGEARWIAPLLTWARPSRLAVRTPVRRPVGLSPG